MFTNILMQLNNSAVYAYYIIISIVHALFVVYVDNLQDEPSSAARPLTALSNY